jgi:predicted nucleic-acid-binding protein
LRGLDTNVLVRFVTGDDPAQTRRVDALFAAAAATGDRFFVSVIVLCELSWALRGAPYGLDREQIAAVLGRILAADLFDIQDRSLVRRALVQYGAGRADFADYLLGQQSRAAGCADTVTFDRQLAGAPGFNRVE